MYFDILLSSANEVWVGHGNAARPSFRPSFRQTCERDILGTTSPIDFKLEM